MRARSLVAAGLAVTLWPLAPTLAGEATPPRRERIALERLRAAGVSEALAVAVEEGICAALLERGGADVVCPSDREAAARLARQAAILGECASDDCLRRLDRVGEADRRVSGALERGEGGGLVLRLWIERPGAPEGPRVEERLPGDPEALLARIPAAVAKLFP